MLVGGSQCAEKKHIGNFGVRLIGLAWLLCSRLSNGDSNTLRAHCTERVYLVYTKWQHSETYVLVGEAYEVLCKFQLCAKSST